MIKKSKFILTLLFIVIVGISNNVSAQTRTDVDGMVEFYEWTLEVEFTPAQRAQLQKFLESDFREDAAKARRNVNTILQTFGEIKNADAETRRETRKLYLQQFLPNLREKEASEADAHFLLEIYRAAHGGRDVFTEMDSALGDPFDQQADKLSETSDLQNLTGKWFRSTGSGSITDGTGKTKYGSGTTYYFEFFPDGTVEYKSESKTLSIMQCRIESTQKARGPFTVNGNTLTINLGPMSDVGTDSCSAKGNYRKTLEASTMKINFQVKKLESILRPDHPTVLCFDGSDGEACFERMR